MTNSRDFRNSNLSLGGGIILNAFEKLSTERKNGILDAAASVFAEEGYHFARIAKVCQVAGVSNGALYKYFSSKEDLFFAVLDRGVNLIVNELYNKFTVNTKSIFDTIGSFLAAQYQFNKEYSSYMTIYCDLGSSSMKRFAANASKKFESIASMYTIKLIEAGKKRGEINKNISSEVAAYLVDSYITFFVYSNVSEYHAQRFDSFFARNENTFSVKERIEIILDSLRQIMG